MPKTAGSSFQASLATHYGDDLVLRYQDKPLHRSAWSRNFDAGLSCLRNGGSKTKEAKARCIHGHFLPLRYRFLHSDSPLEFVTWLREPVQRLVSHYHYWLRSYEPGQSGLLHQRMIEEKWTLEKFALCKEMRNVYSIFLWGFPITRFDFIGITEDYENELTKFGQQILRAPIVPEEHNRNPQQKDQEYVVSNTLRRDIEKAHAADLRLYQQALSLRDQRVIKPNLS